MSLDIWLEERATGKESKKNLKRFSRDRKENKGYHGFHRDDKSHGHKTINGKGIVGKLNKK